MSKKRYTKKEILNYLEEFKAAIPKRLEQAKELLQKNKLDYSYKEIDSIGIIYKEYVDERINSGEWEKPTDKTVFLITEDDLLMNADWHNKMFEIFMTYYGQAWIEYFGGEWSIITRKNDVHYRFPIVIKWGAESEFNSRLPVPPALEGRAYEKGFNTPLCESFEREVKYYELSPELNFQPKIKNN